MQLKKEKTSCRPINKKQTSTCLKKYKLITTKLHKMIQKKKPQYNNNMLCF